MGLFRVAETHDDDPHEFHILEPAHVNWLYDLATKYRELRTYCDLPLGDIRLDGVTVLSTEALQMRMIDAAVPVRRGGNFDVVRSDFGEVALAVYGEEAYGYSYGYRSVRDRELVQFPGRGIDQIGVAATKNPTKILVALGEAKVSSDQRSPPGVVDTSDDCLRIQHLHHLSNLAATADKVLLAARRCADPSTQELMLIAAELLRQKKFDNLTVCCHSFVARPASLAVVSDCGSFKLDPSAYAPGLVRFTLLRLPADDMEAIIGQFEQIARNDSNDPFKAQEEE